MKLDELLNRLLFIANTHVDPSAVEVQIMSQEHIHRDDLPAPIQQATYRGPNNIFKSSDNIPRVELEI